MSPIFELEYADLSTKPSGGTIKLSAWETLEPILARFTAEPEDSGAYMILRSPGLGFVQSARSARAFMLECHSDASDTHYECPPPVDARLVAEIFQLYLANPATILDLAPWQEMEL